MCKRTIINLLLIANIIFMPIVSTCQNRDNVVPAICGLIRLDSLTRNDGIVEIDVSSEKYLLFVNLLNELDSSDFICITKSHENPAIRAYGFIALKILGINQQAEKLYAPNHKRITFCLGDVCWIYGPESADAFMKKIDEIKYRLIKVLNRNQGFYQTIEPEVIIKENEIRKEQGVPPR